MRLRVVAGAGKFLFMVADAGGHRILRYYYNLGGLKILRGAGVKAVLEARG